MKYVVTQLTFTLAATSCISTLCPSHVVAQCSRGGSGGGAGSAASRVAAQTSLAPAISYASNLQALAYQRQLAQQQLLLAQQRQQYLRALAMQRAQLELQSRSEQAEGEKVEPQISEVATTSMSQRKARRQRQLETNAKRLYRQAIAAEANRNYGMATLNYRRIVRMLDNDSELAMRAQTSLEQLGNQQESVAGLASNLAR